MAAGGRHALPLATIDNRGTLIFNHWFFNAPNNLIWLTRADLRITGACIGNGTITLM